jgi:Domain of unknown function (DUF5655)
MKDVKLWTCPKCNRQFQRQNQSHSCMVFPLENHFEGKDRGKALYEILTHKLEQQIGSFKIQSLACCIHFDYIATFAAVKICRTKIQVELSLRYKISAERVKKIVQISANQYLHFIDITNEKDIDKTLITWLAAAYANKAEKVVHK